MEVRSRDPQPGDRGRRGRPRATATTAGQVADLAVGGFRGDHRAGQRGRATPSGRPIRPARWRLTVQRAELIVTARTYNDAPQGTFGQFLPGVTFEGGIAPGRGRAAFAAQQQRRVRTNIGFVDLGGNGAVVRIRLFDGGGDAVGSAARPRSSPPEGGSNATGSSAPPTPVTAAVATPWSTSSVTAGPSGSTRRWSTTLRVIPRPSPWKLGERGQRSPATRGIWWPESPRPTAPTRPSGNPTSRCSISRVRESRRI